MFLKFTRICIQHFFGVYSVFYSRLARMICVWAVRWFLPANACSSHPNKAPFSCTKSSNNKTRDECYRKDEFECVLLQPPNLRSALMNFNAFDAMCEFMRVFQPHTASNDRLSNLNFIIFAEITLFKGGTMWCESKRDLCAVSAACWWARASLQVIGAEFIIRH